MCRHSLHDLVAGRPPTEYVVDPERLYHVRTNREMGLTRTDGEATTIRPADDRGAVATLTDRRLTFAVGDPPDFHGDFLTTVPYTDIAAVETATDTLTERLQVTTTGGVTWLFTAREGGLGEVASFLAAMSDCLATVETLEYHCEMLSYALESGDWTTFDAQAAGALETLDAAREAAADAPVESPRARVEAVATDLYTAVRDRYLRAGRAHLEAADSLVKCGSFRAGRDRFRAAETQFEKARRVVTDRAVDAGPVTDGFEAAEGRIQEMVTRAVTVAHTRYAAVGNRTDLGGRIDALEDALDAYQTLSDILSPEYTTFCSNREDAAREAAESIIETLVDARLERADKHETAGDHGLDAGNDEAAYERFVAARDDLARALELASAYPPGDADDIRRRREAVAEKVDPLATGQERAEPTAI